MIIFSFSTPLDTRRHLRNELDKREMIRTTTRIVLTRYSFRHSRFPTLNLRKSGRISFEGTSGSCDILDVRRLPRLSRLDDDWIQMRRIFTDMLEPRVPFWRDLTRIIIMNFVIYPSISKHRFARVFKIFVTMFVYASKSSRFRVADVPQLPDVFPGTESQEVFDRSSETGCSHL